MVHFVEFYTKNSGLLNQVLPKSCAATCCSALFTYLLYSDEILSAQTSLALQLTIYSKIWEHRGGLANQKKAVAYLQTFYTGTIEPTMVYDKSRARFFNSNTSLTKTVKQNTFYLLAKNDHVLLATTNGSKVNMFDFNNDAQEQVIEKKTLDSLLHDEKPEFFIEIDPKLFIIDRIKQEISSAKRNIISCLNDCYLNPDGTNSVLVPPLEKISALAPELIENIIQDERLFLNLTDQDIDFLERNKIKEFQTYSANKKQLSNLTRYHIDVIRLKGFKKEQVAKLNEYQLRGILAGLTKKQVDHKWFNNHYCVLAAEKEIDYDEYAGLTVDQISHGILKGLPREKVEGLTWGQVRGVAAGLDRKQVEFPWFTNIHAQAAEKGIDYIEYAEKTNNEVIIIIEESNNRNKMKSSV